MIRPVFLLIVTAVLAVPATAASYSARLSTPASGHIVARDINWACGGNTCRGATPESRPAVLCQALAKKAGKVEAFLVDGQAFGVAELERCNASIKAGDGKTAGSQ